MRVYLDASVVGGFFDEEFAESSRQLVDAILRGVVVPLVSETLAAEIADAPEEVQALLGRITAAGAERLSLSAEAIDLQGAYLAAGVVTPTYADDAMHVAQATVARADVVASWNFRHLVNPARVRAFNGVNLAHGYGMVVILTPADVIKGLEADDEHADYSPEGL